METLASIASPSSVKSYQQLLQPSLDTPKGSDGDFEPTGQDDDALFSFDEEVGLKADDPGDLDGGDGSKACSAVPPPEFAN